MATNLEIDNKLIEEAVKLSDFKTKKAAVTEALEEYVNRKKQLKILEVFNTIVYEKSYNYKKQRKVK